MIIQWGYATKPSSGQSTTITFPVAFSSTNYSLSWGTEGSSDNGDNYYCRYMLSRSTTKITIKDFLLNRYAIRWIAVGY